MTMDETHTSAQVASWCDLYDAIGSYFGGFPSLKCKQVDTAPNFERGNCNNVDQASTGHQLRLAKYRGMMFSQPWGDGSDLAICRVLNRFDPVFNLVVGNNRRGRRSSVGLISKISTIKRNIALRQQT